jgi:hypothetical protein
MSYRAAVRKSRYCSARRSMSEVSRLCQAHGISMRRTDHGYQFALHEYRINWAPATNKVSVQYRIPGDGRTVSFTKKGRRGKPRIVIALKELIDLTRSEGRCHAS